MITTYPVKKMVSDIENIYKYNTRMESQHQLEVSKFGNKPFNSAEMKIKWTKDVPFLWMFLFIVNVLYFSKLMYVPKTKSFRPFFSGFSLNSRRTKGQ